MLSLNDRVIYDGQKATVIQVWKKTVRILTAGMEKMNVAIADLSVADGQLELIDTARYERPQAGFTDWEMENGDIDERENAIAPVKESGLPAIDQDETEWIGKFVECRVWPVSRGTIIADHDPYYWLAENENGRVVYRKGWVIEIPESSISPPDIELESDRIPISESSISPPDIELESDRIPISESSISPPDIELESDRPPESSISPPDIELSEPSSITGFNVYPKLKNGKTYHYWRYSYRNAGKMKHIHIGSGDRVKDLQGKTREEILAAIAPKKSPLAPS